MVFACGLPRLRIKSITTRFAVDQSSLIVPFVIHRFLDLVYRLLQMVMNHRIIRPAKQVN